MHTSIKQSAAAAALVAMTCLIISAPAMALPDVPAPPTVPALPTTPEIPGRPALPAKPGKPGRPGKPQKPAKTTPAAIGIADQHGESFTSPLFAALGVKHVRLNLAWDALQYDWQVAQLDSWMTHAQAAGVQPLVIFSQSRVQGRTRLLPSTAEFRSAVDAIMARYPFVREFAAWNEANHTGQPTYRRPDAVAAFYKVLVSRCAGCAVLPASLLDKQERRSVDAQAAQIDPPPRAPGPEALGSAQLLRRQLPA